ncbi:MAG: hypothetical protein KDM63_04890 [Verrucomicrobiae bacterium]|nr:hypothetical protein [Verrucomicrobiae bacterium]MCB1086359.1 hypothetical protein [Verrucomicrobiae bacterium]MCB1092657.1 hypothetical protein [Verrucomicrobiae bacterium]
MSQLYQMQVTYAPVEDRMLFRVNTKQRQEFRFWFTRRYVAILWKTILGYLRTRSTPESPAIATAPEPIKDAIIAKEHEEQVAKSDFKTQYQESSYLPLGESPLLLFGVGIKNGPEDQAILCMHPQNGEGIEVTLNDQITHSLCRLIADAAKKAEWGLDLDFSQASKYLPDQGQGLN